MKDERFKSLPSNWVKVDVLTTLRNHLIGRLAITNHPITVLNPEETFGIVDVNLEHDPDLEYGRIFVRGEKTCWFGQDSFKINVGL